jgi:hypothetical protein
MIRKIIYIVVFLGICTFMSLSASSVFDYRGTTYYVDDERFENFQQAQEYQANIVDEAQKVGAKVDDFTMTIQSPPTVSWRVRMPQSIWDNNQVDFKYGERLTRIESAKIQSIGLMVLCGVISLFGAWYIFIRKISEDE